MFIGTHYYQLPYQAQQMTGDEEGAVSVAIPPVPRLKRPFFVLPVGGVCSLVFKYRSVEIR